MNWPIQAIADAIAANTGTIRYCPNPDLYDFTDRPCSDRRDPDNIAGFARKAILDALVKRGILAGDGWKNLAMPSPFVDTFAVDKHDPHIDVTIVEVRA